MARESEPEQAIIESPYKQPHDSRKMSQDAAKVLKMTSKMAPERNLEQAKIKRLDKQPQDSRKMAQDAAKAAKMTSKMAPRRPPRPTPSRQKSRGQIAS